MRLKTSLPLFLLLLAIIADTQAGRSGGSGRGGGGGRSSGGRGRSSGGSRGWFGGLFGGKSSSKSHGTSHTSTNHGSSTGTHHSSGTSTSQQNKDTSLTFLQAEGGGSRRPSEAKPVPYPSGNTRPSAPPAPNPNQHFYPPLGSGNVPHNPVNGHPNPPWSNPSHGTGHTTSQVSPNHGRRIHTGNHTSPHHGGNPPYPVPHGGNPPYPVPHGGNPPYPVPHGGNPPYPVNTGGNPPYPVPHGGNPPYPVPHGGNPPYPVPHGGNPPYPVPPVNRPSSYPPLGSGAPIGSQSYPPSSHPYPIPPIHTGQTSHDPFNKPPPGAFGGNPYVTHSVGGAPNVHGQPHYPQQQPQILAQPAAQPFVPGQTVIMVPGQQDSGRGIGQIFKEALVFSAVNAGVNRLINGPRHVTESKPADPHNHGGSTQITYNNYYNTSPGGTNGGNPPNGNVPPATSTGIQNGVNVPPYTGAPVTTTGNTGNVNVQSGGVATGIPNGGAISTIAAGAAGGVAGANGSNQSNNQANTNNNAPAPNMYDYRVSDDDLYKITEDLFAKQTFNLSKYITLNLQNRTISPNVTDQAKQPLLFVQPELLDYPSISVTRALFDNYEHDSQKKETRTLEKRKEENLLIDTYLNTNIMASAMRWLADKGFINPDDFERKDILRRIWFTHFNGATCGFERVFLSEKYDNSLLGVQDWLYFDYQESQKRIDYMGYADKMNLGNSSSLLKLNFQMDGVVRPNTTIFVGTLPELEMSLYTICFYARPNNLCPVSLGGTKFHLFTHAFRYFGSDLIDLGVIVF